MNAEVMFRLAGAAQPLILVPVTVNGVGPHEFILDTGAGTCLLSPELARMVGVRPTGVKEGTTAGGKVSVALGRVESLAIGMAKVEDVEVGIVDLSDLGRAVGARIDGDIGYNFLHRFEVTIDYRRSVLRLSRRGSGAEGNTAAAGVPFALGGPSKPLVLLDVHVNDRGPFRFALDTGSSTTVFAPELAQALGMSLTDIPAVATGGGHAITAFAGQARSLAVGPARVTDLPVMVADFLGMLSQAVGMRLDGILGYNYLRQFQVVIDYPGHLLRLT